MFCLWVCFCCHSGICAQHRDKDGRGNGPKAIASGSIRKSQLSGLNSHTRHGQEQSAKSWGKELIVKCCFRGRKAIERKCVFTWGQKTPEVVCCDRWIRFSIEHPSGIHCCMHVNLWCGYPCDLGTVVTLHTIIMKHCITASKWSCLHGQFPSELRVTDSTSTLDIASFSLSPSWLQPKSATFSTWV